MFSLDYLIYKRPGVRTLIEIYEFPLPVISILIQFRDGNIRLR